jgi:hypothetical protein
MHTRRAFLKHVSVLAGCPALAKTDPGHDAGSPLIDRLGVGLFTVPTMLPLIAQRDQRDRICLWSAVAAGRSRGPAAANGR